MLLWTRTSVLCRRFEAVSASSIEDLTQLADQTFSLIVLCYTLSEGETLTAFEFIRQTWPAAKVLSLRTPHGPAPSIPADFCLDSLCGPIVLLETADALTAPQPPTV